MSGPALATDLLAAPDPPIGSSRIDTTVMRPAAPRAIPERSTRSSKGQPQEDLRRGALGVLRAGTSWRAAAPGSTIAT